MSLLLIRHGETALNVARVLQPAGTPLGERGRRQAVALADRLTAEHSVAAIVSSDLPRACETAEAIARATGVRVESSPLWRERDFGDWRGRRYDSFAADPLAHDGAPPGGETGADFEARVGRAFEAALIRHAALAGQRDAALAIVTHGLVIRVLFDRRLAWPTGRDRPTHLGNTGLSIVEVEPPFRLRLVDCTRHLASGLSDDSQALSGG